MVMHAKKFPRLADRVSDRVATVEFEIDKICIGIGIAVTAAWK